MATEKILNTRIINKHALLNEWNSSTLKLKEGEIALARIDLPDSTSSTSGDNNNISTTPAYIIKVGAKDTEGNEQNFENSAWAYAKAVDVYAWAKAATKPTYAASEIGGLTEFVEGISEIDTDLNTKYTFEIPSEGDNKGKLVITPNTWSKGVAGADETPIVLDVVTPDELNTILAGYVKSVSGKEAIKSTGGQSPEISLALDNSGNVQFTQSDDGLKGDVDLSNFATKAEIPTDFGVLSVTGDEVVVANPTTGAVILETKLDNSGNVKFSKTTDGLKGTIDLTHNHDNQYAPKDHDHSKYVVTVDTTTTIEDGVLKHYIFKQDNKEIAHIDIPKDLVVESGSIGTVTKANDPYTGAVIGDKYIDLKIANQDEHLYIPAKSLVDIYTAQANAAQVQLAIDNKNEISATLVDGAITANKFSSEINAFVSTLVDQTITGTDTVKTPICTLPTPANCIYNSDTHDYDYTNGEQPVSIQIPIATNFAVATDYEIVINHSSTNFGPVNYTYSPTTGTFTFKDDPTNKSDSDTLANLGLSISISENIATVTLARTESGDGWTFDAEPNNDSEYSGTVIEISTVNNQLGIEKGAQVNKIDSVSNNFSISADKQLELAQSVKDSLANVDSAVQEVIVYQTMSSGASGGSGGKVGFDICTKDAADNESTAIAFEIKAANDGYININTDLSVKDESLIAELSLDTTAKAAISAAQTAVQEITSNCTTDQDTSGLKVTRTENSVNVEIDDAVTFIFDCGGAE